MPTTLTLAPPGPGRFDLHRAVCSYGYFLLAPNHWDVQRKVLHRPLRLSPAGGKRVVHATLSQRRDGRLRLVCVRHVDRSEHAGLKAQVARMLRFGEGFGAWHKLHPAARRRRFDRMFRSPTLFEDLVKTITSCNVTWRNTITMNRLMVQHVGDGGFPTPGQLADYGEERLKARCKVGYRAGRIVQLARRVVSGELDLAWFEHPGRTSDDLYQGFLAIHGLGPYAASNLVHLCGHYDRLPIDTETYRHYCHVHGVKRPKNPATLHPRIDRYYGRYKPYQFLAYWFELWEDYQSRFGPAWRWDRETTGTQFTASVLK